MAGTSLHVFTIIEISMQSVRTFKIKYSWQNYMLTCYFTTFSYLITEKDYVLFPVTNNYQFMTLILH